MWPCGMVGVGSRWVVRLGLAALIHAASFFARDVGIPAWDDRVGFAPQQRTKMFFGSWTDKVAFEEEDPILGWGAQKDEVTF